MTSGFGVEGGGEDDSLFVPLFPFMLLVALFVEGVVEGVMGGVAFDDATGTLIMMISMMSSVIMYTIFKSLIGTVKLGDEL